MITVNLYKNHPISFFKNLIRAYDFFIALNIPNPKQKFHYIKNNSSKPFGEPKFLNIQKRDGTIELVIFLNLRQIIICLEYLHLDNFIKHEQVWDFLNWYTGILDQEFEFFLEEGKEERIQNKLILLSSYGHIKLIQELTVLALPDSVQRTRRYDIVQFINRTNTVRIRELKSRKINIPDIETTLREKGYLEIATRRWPDKNIELIFSSLEGIEEDASLLVDSIAGVSFEYVQDFGLRLYLNALKNTPPQGWTYFKQNVTTKLAEVLPTQPILTAAENSILQ